MREKDLSRSAKLLQERRSLQESLRQIQEGKVDENSNQYQCWHSAVPEWIVRTLKYRTLLQLVTLRQRKIEELETV